MVLTRRWKSSGKTSIFITTHNELVTTSNKINEPNTEYGPLESHNMDALSTCWQRRLQPAVQKFAGIVSRNKPLSGEVVGDNLMDLYYQRMHAIFSAESHSYKKDVPHDFVKCMKAYYFISVHPKFEVKIPIDGTKPPSKYPNALASEELLDSGISGKPNMSFVIRPPKKSRPAGRETTNRSDAVKFVINKVVKQTNSSINNTNSNPAPL